MKNLISNISATIIFGVLISVSLLSIASKIFNAAMVGAQEPMPPHVEEKVERINSRVLSIQGIDQELKPLKSKIATLQLSRDNLSADNTDDSKSLERWGYEYNWESSSARKVMDLDLGVTLPQ